MCACGRSIRSHWAPARDSSLPPSSADTLGHVLPGGGATSTAACPDATLTLAGVPSGDALAATLLYRVVAYSHPLLAVGVVYLLSATAMAPATLGVDTSPYSLPQRFRAQRG
jgi:hypothetical protein